MEDSSTDADSDVLVRHTSTPFESLDDAAQAASSELRWESADERLDRLQTGARRVLQAAGLPDSLRLVEAQPGHWTGCVEAVRDRAGSLEWYAVEVLTRVTSIRAARERGDHDEALRVAFELGDLLRMGDLELGFGLDVIAGRRSHRSSRKGGKQTPKVVQAWHGVADRLAAKEPPDISIAELARRVRPRMQREAPSLRRIPSLRTLRAHLADRGR